MLPIQGNLGHSQEIRECRLCNREEENQEHIIETCSNIHEKGIRMRYKDIFTNTEPKEIRTIADNLLRIEEILKEGIPMKGEQITQEEEVQGRTTEGRLSISSSND